MVGVPACFPEFQTACLEGRRQPVHSRARLQSGPGAHTSAAHGSRVLSPRGLSRTPGQRVGQHAGLSAALPLPLISVYRSGPERPSSRRLGTAEVCCQPEAAGRSPPGAARAPLSRLTLCPSVSSS